MELRLCSILFSSLFYLGESEYIDATVDIYIYKECYPRQFAYDFMGGFIVGHWIPTLDPMASDEIA